MPLPRHSGPDQVERKAWGTEKSQCGGAKAAAQGDADSLCTCLSRMLATQAVVSSRKMQTQTVGQRLRAPKKRLC